MANPFKSLVPARPKPEATSERAVTMATQPQPAVAARASKPWSVDDLFADIIPDRSLKPPDTETILLNTWEELDEVLAKCKKSKLMVFDFETTGLDIHLHEVVSVQITCERGVGYYVPIFHRDYANNFDRLRVLERMYALMRDPAVRKIGHNLKFDYKWFLKDGFVEFVNFWDTMIAAHVINENRASYSLKTLAAKDLGYEMITFSSLGIHTKAGPCPPDKIQDFSYLPLERALPYACADVDMTLALYEQQLTEIEQEYNTIFFQIEMPLVPVLAKMEYRGVEMDSSYMQALGGYLQQEIDKIYRHMVDLVQSMTVVNQPPPDPSWPDGAPDEELEEVKSESCDTGFSKVARVETFNPVAKGPLAVVLEWLNRGKYFKKLSSSGKRRRKTGFLTEFNWNSSDHLLKLFSVLGIDTERLTPASRKKGAKTKKMSTDKKALQSMARKDGHPGCKIAKALLAYRQLSKITSAFCASLPGRVHVKTGRVHPDFNQTNTVTARLSCSNPNMQQIPKSGVCAIRYPFKPADGFVFLQCDYSQVELRILAHISGDIGMIEAFKSGADIHSLTAYECFVGKGIPEGTPISEIKDKYPKLRNAAKTISFGIVYGMGPQALAETLGITEKEARDYIEAFLNAKPKVKEYMIYRQREMHQYDYVSTPLGRRRHIPIQMVMDEKLGKPRRMRPFGWERKAVNFPIQSASAEVLKHVMARITAEFERLSLPAWIVLQIHDELIVECRKEYVDVALPIMKRVFEEAIEDLGVKFDVPLEADPTVQYRWAIEADKCPVCNEYALSLDGGKKPVLDASGNPVLDARTGRPKEKLSKTCLQCNPTSMPGLWDLEATIRNIEEKALVDPD